MKLESCHLEPKSRRNKILHDSEVVFLASMRMTKRLNQRKHKRKLCYNNNSKNKSSKMNDERKKRKRKRNKKRIEKICEYKENKMN